MNLFKSFCLIAVCVALVACATDEKEDAGCDAAPETVVNFMLAPDKAAYMDMFVVGKWVATENGTAKAQEAKCTVKLISDKSMLQCSLGAAPMNSDLRFMVMIPKADGNNLPACDTLDVEQCHGTVKITVQPLGCAPDYGYQPYAPTVRLVQDPDLGKGVAYQAYIPAKID